MFARLPRPRHDAHPYPRLAPASNLRAIPAAVPSRPTTLPDVPTLAEASQPGFELGALIGLAALVDTPPEVLDKLNASTRSR